MEWLLWIAMGVAGVTMCFMLTLPWQIYCNYRTCDMRTRLLDNAPPWDASAFANTVFWREWHAVEYKILSWTEGRFWQFPINLNTFEQIIGRPSTPEEMQATLEEVAPLMSEEFQRGFKYFSEDPIIKERMTQIQGGALFDASGILMAYNPEVGGKIDDLAAIDPSLNPEEFAAAVKTRDEKVFEDGVRKGRNAGMLEAKKEVQIVETRAKIQQGFTSLVEKHPELKGDGNWAADAAHPANSFYKYILEKGLTDAFMLDKGGFESAYAAFLASDGRLGENIQKTVQHERFKFIRNLKEAQRTEARVVSRSTPSGSAINTNPQIPGIDTDRYLSDPAYALAKFNEVDLPTKRLLEQLRAGKLTPKTT